ncbi:MAG TPA: hypothetical protein VL119_15035 [Acidimicrobiia bacterium]|nr:hypothetical protein [Acidimicrobiia bacterium]
MASSRARSSDIKLIASATVAVILAGLFIAGGMLIATSSGSNNPTCGQLDLGKASDIRDRLDTQGPTFVTGGATCGFWLALEDGTIVAYRVRQPSGCMVNLRDRGTRWVCNGNSVEASTLLQYPVSIQTIGTTDALIVDLTSTGSPTSTATSSPTPTTG